MSRIGNRPIEVPSDVEVQVDADKGHLDIKGPLGEMEHDLPRRIEVAETEDGDVQLERKGDDSEARSLHGLHRSLVANKIDGVKNGVSRKIEIHGTGWGAQVKSGTLVLSIGFCHDVEFELPENIDVEIHEESAQPDRPASFTIKGIDKQEVGNFAAKVRDVRPPEPYKGKGIRYAGEHVRRKEGKAFAGLEA